jgi:hypothetical protein
MYRRRSPTLRRASCARRPSCRCRRGHFRVLLWLVRSHHGRSRWRRTSASAERLFPAQLTCARVELNVGAELGADVVDVRLHGGTERGSSTNARRVLRPALQEAGRDVTVREPTKLGAASLPAEECLGRGEVRSPLHSQDSTQPTSRQASGLAFPLEPFPLHDRPIFLGLLRIRSSGSFERGGYRGASTADVLDPGRERFTRTSTKP